MMKNAMDAVACGAGGRKNVGGHKK